MVPKITRGGTSFKGAFQYYLHDKGAETCNRVAWVHTENMRSGAPDKAWKIMAYTANAQERLKEASGQSRAGRKLEKPVFSFSLAWHPEQDPDQEHMLYTARKAVEALGLSEHEHLIVSHKDEPQKHVHVIVNRVHPTTGLAGDIRNSKRKLSDFARKYEQDHGKIYCEKRVENHKEREKGKTTIYCDPHIVHAWETTTTGKAFAAALAEKGYHLAQGKKRIVVVDPHAKAHSPARHLKNVRVGDIRKRLKDLDTKQLPYATDPAVQFHPVDHEKERQASVERDAGLRIVAMRERHQHEFEGLSSQHTQRQSFAKGRLAEYYDLPRQKAALTALNLKIRNAPWYHRLFGTTRRDRETLRTKAQIYKTAVGNYREKLSHISDQGTKALGDLRTRQEKEFRDLFTQIEMQLQAGKTASQAKWRGHDHSAGELSKIFSLAVGEDPKKNLEKIKDRPDRGSRDNVSNQKSRGL